MKKKKIILACVFAVMSSLMVAGPASAAHCTDEAGTTPGFSYFGTDFVKESGAQGAVDPGASGCPASPVGDPSERAPGQNR
jgi:hypothetical protein